MVIFVEGRRTPARGRRRHSHWRRRNCTQTESAELVL